MNAYDRTRRGSPPRFMSLRTKFVLFISLIITGVCSGLSWYFIEQQAETMSRTLLETGTILAKSLAHNSRYAAITEDKTALEQFIDGVMDNDQVVYAVMTGPDGDVLAAKTKGHLAHRQGLSRIPESPLYPDPTFAQAGLSTRGELRVTAFVASDGNAPDAIYDFAQPIVRRVESSLAAPPLPFSLESQEAKGPSQGRVEQKVLSVAQIGMTQAKMHQALNAEIRKVALITFLIILLGIAGTAVLADRIITPLKTLALVAEQVARGDLDATAEPTTSDEVGQLTGIFNRMTQALKERDHAISSQIDTITKQVTQLTTLNQAGAAITSTFDIDKLLSHVLRILVENLGYQRILLMLYDSDRQVAYGPRIRTGLQQEERTAHGLKIHVEDDGSLHAQMLLHGRPLLITDIEAVADRIYPAVLTLAREAGVTSFVGAPLKSTQRIVGFMTADRGAAACTQDDLDLLMTLAGQIAIAIDNARGYQELTQLTQTLEKRVQDRTQELSSANERLQELDRLRAAFVSVVSHELRTPMTSIKGYIENMLDGLTGGLSEKQSYYLSRVKFNVERLTRMINDLLDLSRIEAGRMELAPASISVADLVGEVTELLQSAAQAKSITLRGRVQGGPVVIQADRDKLYQILTNLIQNAVKFTPPGGEIRLEATGEGEGIVQFTVTDTGCGIAPNEIPKVFERFYRGEAVPAEQRGAGLGLAITKNLVELHGGRIWVESTVGHGSGFIFTIPTSPAPSDR